MVVFLFSLTRLIQSNLNSSSKNSVYISIIMTVYNSENCCRNELNDSKRIYLFIYLFLCSDTGLPLYYFVWYSAQFSKYCSSHLINDALQKLQRVVLSAELTYIDYLQEDI